MSFFLLNDDDDDGKDWEFISAKKAMMMVEKSEQKWQKLATTHFEPYKVKKKHDNTKEHTTTIHFFLTFREFIRECQEGT